MDSDPPQQATLVIEAPIRNSVDPIAHKARNHQTLPNFALLPELCITKHSSNDSAHRRQNGTFKAAVTLDAQSTPLIPDLRKRSLSNVCVRTMAVFAIENDNLFAPNSSGGRNWGNYHVAISKNIPNMNNSIAKIRAL